MLYGDREQEHAREGDDIRKELEACEARARKRMTERETRDAEWLEYVAKECQSLDPLDQGTRELADEFIARRRRHECRREERQEKGLCYFSDDSEIFYGYDTDEEAWQNQRDLELALMRAAYELLYPDSTKCP